MGGFGGAGLIPELFRGILEGGWGRPEGFGGVLGGGGVLGAPRGLLEASWGGNWVHRVVPRAIGGHWGGAGNHSVVPWCIRWGYCGGGGLYVTSLWGRTPSFPPSPAPPPPAAQAPLKPKTPRGTKTPINRNQLSQSRGLAGLVGKRGYEGGAEGHRPPRVRVRSPC